MCQEIPPKRVVNHLKAIENHFKVFPRKVTCQPLTLSLRAGAVSWVPHGSSWVRDFLVTRLCVEATCQTTYACGKEGNRIGYSETRDRALFDIDIEERT